MESMSYGRPRQNREARFWAKVRRSDGCWEWQGSLSSKGYGVFWDADHKNNLLAHRVAYELVTGPIPDGLQLDHLCRNRRCVNPAHLEPVTGKENLLRGDTHAANNASKEVCKNGHPFDVVRPDGSRGCRTCDVEKTRRYQARHRDRYLASQALANAKRRK